MRYSDLAGIGASQSVISKDSQSSEIDIRPIGTESIALDSVEGVELLRLYCKGVSMRRQLILISATIALINAAVAASNPAVLDIGGVEIRIPAPDGFFRIDGIDHEYDRLARSLVPPHNRSIAQFGTERELAELLAGRWPSAKRGFGVQVMRALESVRATRSQFDRIKDRLKTDLLEVETDPEFQRLIREMELGISKGFFDLDGTAHNVTIGNPIPLGIYDETAESLLFSMLMTAYVDGANDDDIFVGMVSGACIHINERVLYLYATSEYVDNTDIEWVRTALMNWRDEVVKANQGRNGLYRGSTSHAYTKPHEPTPSQPTSRRTDANRVFASVLAAGLIVFVIGLVRAVQPEQNRERNNSSRRSSLIMYNAYAARDDGPLQVMQIAATSSDKVVAQLEHEGWRVDSVEPSE